MRKLQSYKAGKITMRSLFTPFGKEQLIPKFSRMYVDEVLSGQNLLQGAPTLKSHSTMNMRLVEQLLDEVFVISRTIKVQVGVISLSQ